MIRIKYLLVLIISVLILNACGVKGPVKPIKEKPSTSSTPIDKETAEKPGSCGN